MKKWIPCELHTHTLNSDGNLTLVELAGKAKEMGLECIALTDHNTISGHIDRERAQKQSGIDIIRGLEWTTFYGHMVAMGIDEYIDWRNRGPSDIHEGISDIHKAGGLAGVAHPYRLGSPMCTGCYWNFEIKDWSDVDYLEVWSEAFPSIDRVNKRAFRLWTEILNKGHKLTAVSGRDWHGSDCCSEPVAVTYLEIDRDKGNIEKAVKDAIAGGHASITMGPLLLLYIELQPNSDRYVVGDSIKTGSYKGGAEFIIQVDYSERKGHWQLDEEMTKAVLVSNKGIIAEVETSPENNSITCALQIEGLTWVRAELYGKLRGIDTMLAFTNPVYFESLNET